MIGPWRPSGDHLWDEHLEATYKKWEGTKYWAGQQLRGVYVDCIGFACGFLDDLLGRQPYAPVPSSEEELLAHFPLVRLRGHHSRPGDLIFVGKEGPSHALIVAPKKNVIWHCPGNPGSYVTQSGLHALALYGFIPRAAFRLKARL